MGFYVVVAIICLAAFPFAWRRSGGSMTRYVLGTGAPLVLLALVAFAVVAAAVSRTDPELAREMFTGGLIGSGITQFILLRRGQDENENHG